MIEEIINDLEKLNTVKKIERAEDSIIIEAYDDILIFVKENSMIIIAHPDDEKTNLLHFIEFSLPAPYLPVILEESPNKNIFIEKVQKYNVL
jgi:hypothetical protein